MIIVTGASGFLGQTLVRRIRQSGYSVVGVSRSKVERSSFVSVNDYIDTPGGDVLIHLAEGADRMAAVETSRCQNVKTLHSLLGKGFRRVIYASSAAVYGDHRLMALSVDDEPAPGDAYAEQKLACEKLVIEAGGVVARLSNLYGPGMSEGNVLSKIIRQLRGSGDLEVWDDTPVRDYLWIEDAANAISMMVSGTNAGCYNVGSGEGVSVKRLIELILRLASQEGRSVNVTRPTERHSCNFLDISKTVDDFGWHPDTSLADGMNQLMNNALMS